MKRIGNVLWHPFRSISWMRWTLRRRIWLVLTLGLLWAVCHTLSTLGYHIASTVVFDAFVVRTMCFAAQSLLDRVPDKNLSFVPKDDEEFDWAKYDPSVSRISNGVPSIAGKSDVKVFIS